MFRVCGQGFSVSEWIRTEAHAVKAAGLVVFWRLPVVQLGTAA